MSVFSDLLNILKPNPYPAGTAIRATNPPAEQELDPQRAMAEGSTAWSDMSTWFAAQLKYNPDTLIGRKGFVIWNQMMLDEQVKAAVQFRRASVTGRDWFFELDADKTGLSKEECKRRIDINSAMIEKCYQGPFSDGLNSVMRAQWQGNSWSEIMIGQYEHEGSTYFGLQKLRPKPYETFFCYVDEFGDVIKWVQRRLGTGTEREIDYSKFVHYVNSPDMDEHYGQSELRSAYRWWFAKDFTIKFMNVFAERLAGGFVVVRPTDNNQTSFTVNSPEFVSIKNALNNISGSTSMILPTGFQCEVHYAPGSQVGVYDSIIGMQDLAIAKSLLIPNLLGMSNPKAQTGSHSQGVTQFDAFIVVSDDDADRVADVLNESVFMPLNQQNFTDGFGPLLRFKPVSETKRAQMLTTWVGLVQAKAVEPSDTDEQHVRDMLDFPEKGEPLVDPAAAAPGSSTPVGQKEQGGAGRSPPGAQEPFAQESLRGAKLMELQTFAVAKKRWEGRVHFEVLGRQSDAERQKWVSAIEEAFAELVAEGVSRIEQERLGSDQRSIEASGRFDLDAMKTRSVNTQVSRMLRAGMQIGETHARREVDAAKKEQFSRRFNADRLGELAAEWMKQKAFTITGDLKAGAVKEIKNTLVNGLKYNWSQEQVTDGIYKALVQKGFLSGAVAAEALGLGNKEALAERLGIQTGLTASRLDTIVRTNMFEAINEARLNAFTDPSLNDFVKAMTYSAVLDSRTTTICQHMDGRTYTNDQWEGALRPWVPPNHFNCRSLLIPVTVADMDSVDLTTTMPTIEPQEGFG